MNTYELKPEEMPVISIDFDGVIVTDKWPDIGEEIPGAVGTINGWYDAGYWIIINSCRDHKEKADMIVWLQRAGVRYHAMNENLVWRICMYGTDPRKIGADIYIDDHNILLCNDNINQSAWLFFYACVKAYTRRKAEAINKCSE